MRKAGGIFAWIVAGVALLALGGCPDDSGSGNGDESSGGGETTSGGDETTSGSEGGERVLVGTWSFDVPAHEAWMKTTPDWEGMSESEREAVLKMVTDRFGPIRFTFNGDGTYAIITKQGEEEVTEPGTWEIKEKEEGGTWLIMYKKEGSERERHMRVHWTDDTHVAITEVRDGVEDDDLMHFKK